MLEDNTSGIERDDQILNKYLSHNVTNELPLIFSKMRVYFSDWICNNENWRHN